MVAVRNRWGIPAGPTWARILERGHVVVQGIPLDRTKIFPASLGDVQFFEPHEPRAAEHQFLPASGTRRRDQRRATGRLHLWPDYEHTDRPALYAVRAKVFLVG